MNKERYTVGRLPDNDIRIDNSAVSGHHSLIINILNDSFLEDLNSTNGTYVNGKLIKKHALQHGDVDHRRPSPAALRRQPGREPSRTNSRRRWSSSRRSTRRAREAAADPPRRRRSSRAREPPPIAGRSRGRRQGAHAGRRRPSCRCCPARSPAASSSSTKALTTLGRPGRPGRRDHAPRRRLLHRARRQRQAGRLPAGQRHRRSARRRASCTTTT